MRGREGAGGVAALAAVAALALSLPFWANPGTTFLTGLVAIEIVFALSWNLLFGYTGLVSFGHAAFFAVGAYVTGYLLREVPAVPFLVVLAAATGAGALTAALVGIVALRRATGIYFAILTLALAQVLHTAIGYSTALGREDGLSGIPRPVLNFGIAAIDLAQGANYYWFLLVACGLLIAALWWLCHGRIGRVLRAIRQDPERVAFMGVDVHAYRLLAFVVAGTVAACAGALQAPWTQIVTPDVAHWHRSTAPILNTLLGGASSFFGPAIGATVFSAIGYGTRTLVGLSEIVIGSILLAVVLLAPGGIVGLVARARGSMARKRGSPPDAGRTPVEEAAR